MRLWRKIGLAASAIGAIGAFAGSGDLENSWLGKYAAEPGAQLAGYVSQSVHGNALLVPQFEVLASYALDGFAVLCLLLGVWLWPQSREVAGS